jgi:hypothetical protein
VIDPKIASTDRGKWAIKWSFAVLMVTALLQMAVVTLSDSVALLADTLHNFGDAFTAIPLWIAFSLTRRKPSRRFTYGLGRLEDLAGVLMTKGSDGYLGHFGSFGLIRALVDDGNSRNGVQSMKGFERYQCSPRGL